MKQRGIMGVVVFTSNADENLPTQAQILFKDEVIYFSFIHTQQTAMGNYDPLLVINTNTSMKELSNWLAVFYTFTSGHDTIKKTIKMKPPITLSEIVISLHLNSVGWCN